jgi:uncharacterized protein YaeQ
MALKATVYKAELQVSDIDRGYYAEHTLTLARHPSETEERLMVRVLAFAMHAGDALEFGRGLSTDDEPDLWQRDVTGGIEHWLEVGLPDERRLRRAAGRAARVTLIAYGQRAFDVWWQKHQAALARLDRLTVWSLPDDTVAAVGALATRNMTLQCIVQDGELVVSDATTSVTVAPRLLQRATRP